MNLPAGARTLLWPLSVLYGLAVRFRVWLYRSGVLSPRRLDGVVISVGNLTVGGTGKTPMVIWLAERLLGESKRVGILTRGYRGSDGTSDEVEVLRRWLDARVEMGIGANRFAQGRSLAAKGIRWFLLDDGFQHLRLARDVDIVLIDSTDPFGGGRLLPAGRLREPKSALARADLVVITRTDRSPAIETALARCTPAPVFYAVAEFAGLLPVHPRPDSIGADLPDKKVFAFCGLGNPRAFFDDLRRWGFQLAGEAVFPDHHRYTDRDVALLESHAARVGVCALICAEKDVANLRDTEFRTLPVFACRMTWNVLSGEGFWSAIQAALARKPAAQTA